jgi:flagellar protein FliS
MTPHASGEYLRNTVMTATPEQLQLMLYDGAIRFARQGREAIERKDYETSCEKLIRAQEIVSAMQNGLRPDVNPELCAQLTSLYNFIYRRLIEGNTKQDLAAIDEAVKILEHQRETWVILMDKIRGTTPGGGAEAKRTATADRSPRQAEATPAASLSVHA